MFLSCSHFNVSPFARNVSTLAAIMTAGGALTLLSYLWAARALQSQDGLRRNGLR